MNYYDDVPTEPAQRPRMSWPSRIFWLAAFLGASGYGCYQKDYVIAIVPIVVMLSAFSGFRIGALRMVGSLGAIALAVAYAPQMGLTYEVKFASWFGTSGLANRFMSIGVVGVLISLVVTLMFIILTNRFVARRPRLAWLNQWCGFFLASAQGALAVLLLLGGMLIMEPMQQKLADEGVKTTASGQRVSNLVLTTAKYTRESKLGSHIEQYNPFVRVPQLNKLDQVQQTVQVLNDPEKIDGLLKHPKLVDLKERPETKRAVAELMSDPQIREILSAKKSMDKSSVMTLMNHPAILNLIDQPGFVETAMKIIASPDGIVAGHVTANPLIP